MLKIFIKSTVNPAQFLKWPLFILARRAKGNLHEDAYRPTRDFTNV